MKGWQKGLMRRTKATRGRMGSIFADFMHADKMYLLIYSSLKWAEDHFGSDLIHLYHKRPHTVRYKIRKKLVSLIRVNVGHRVGISPAAL